jgi:hypothetical protein
LYDALIICCVARIVAAPKNRLAPQETNIKGDISPIAIERATNLLRARQMNISADITDYYIFLTTNRTEI